MDEYLSEQEQWERVKQWVRENALWVLLGVLVAAGGLWGYYWREQRVETTLIEAAQQFDTLVASFAAGDLAKAEQQTNALVEAHPGTGYADQARLTLARLLLEGGQAPKALEFMQVVLADTRDEAMKPLVRLRIARVQIDQQQADAALATLAASEAGAYAARFAEVRGDALYAKGDRAGALQAYQEAASGDGESVDAELLKLKINELSRS